MDGIEARPQGEDQADRVAKLGEALRRSVGDADTDDLDPAIVRLMLHLSHDAEVPKIRWPQR